MRNTSTMAAFALLLAAAASQAAKPTSIVFETHSETDEGKPYSQFTVKCNDGRQVPLTAWDGMRKWCVGKDGAGGCKNKQISAARTACGEA